MLVVVSWGAAAACGAEEGPIDPDLTDDRGSPVPERSLELAGEEALRLRFGESADLSFVYRALHSNDPVTDPVTFAIEGRAGDSSLSQVEVRPDPQGRVATTLRAGTVAASFRVRATALGAAAAYVEVSVGDAGFGAIEVASRYTGTRELWSVELRLYAERGCGEIDPRRAPIAGRSVRIGGQSPSGRWDGAFGNLAVGPRYTVLALGLGQGDGVVASGCSANVLVEAEPAPPVALTVTLEDQPYGASGRYELDSTLGLGPALNGRVDQWLEPATTLLAGGSESFLIDQIVLHLSIEGATADQAALAEQRTALSERLRERLAAGGADPAVALDALAGDLEASMSGPVLRSELLLDEVVDAMEQRDLLRFSHEAFELSVDLVAGGVAVGPRSVGFADAGLVSLASGDASTSTTDLDLAEHHLPFRLGTLTAVVLAQALVPELGAETLAEHLTSVLDCAALGLWLDAETEIECTASCFEAACHEAADVLANTVDQSLRSGDADYDSLWLEGRATQDDGDGDAATDALLAGTWTARLSGAQDTPVAASFQGTREDIE